MHMHTPQQQKGNTMIRGGGWWSADQIAAMILEAKAQAWDEGYAANERNWEFTFDIVTPDEERQPLTNPYQ